MKLHQALSTTQLIDNQQDDAATAHVLGYTPVRHCLMANTAASADANANAIAALHATHPVHFFRLAIAGFATLAFASGCNMFSKPAEKIAPATPVVLAPVVQKPTALTAAAQAALVEARDLAAEASAATALWPSAASLLSQAEAAAIQFDSQLTIKLSKVRLLLGLVLESIGCQIEWRRLQLARAGLRR